MRRLTRAELDRVGAATGIRVTGVRLLRGGLATATYALSCSDGSRLVVKRYPVEDETAALEWERLKFATRAAVPSPTPVALDITGAWFGSHALVMTALPGKPHFVADDRWLSSLAGATAAIHATDVAEAAGALVQPHQSATWIPPRGVRKSPRTQQIIRAIERSLPHVDRRPTALLHGDLHPGNLLWRGADLTGIADWSAARLGPPAFEVAYTRADLTVIFGGSAADRYAQKYSSITGADLSDLPVWDLVCGLQAMAWHHRWLVSYAEQGLVIPPSTARQRLVRWTDAALTATE